MARRAWHHHSDLLRLLFVFTNILDLEMLGDRFLVFSGTLQCDQRWEWATKQA